MQSVRVLASITVLLVCGGGAPTAVVAAPPPSDWLAGPAAVGDSVYTGAIDLPTAGARLATAGPVRLAGWFVDRTAQGWAGADDIEIFLGAMGNGGVPLAHAYFAQPRPDVAAALGNPYWEASGWTAIFNSSALLPGSNSLSVYAHTPTKGWWYRQVSVTVGREATSRAAPAAVGFDISFPQCGGAEPTASAFGIVGVNGGRSFTANPCLARQYVWALGSLSPAQPHVSFYMNTGNPGPTVSTHWPAPGTASPQPCDGSWSAACAYDYGWFAAEDAYARARAVAGEGARLAPWWLDVETANSWSADTATNSADLQGAIDYLRSAGVGSVGIYALAADWEEIVGAAAANAPQNLPFSALPTWRPGPRSAAEAPSWCARSVTGGRILLVQYPSGSLDANFVCP
jgi:hypothetical protein